MWTYRVVRLVTDEKRGTGSEGRKEAEEGGGRMLGHSVDWFGTGTWTATDIISSSEETTLFCSKNNGQHEFGFI